VDFSRRGEIFIMRVRTLGPLVAASLLTAFSGSRAQAASGLGDNASSATSPLKWETRQPIVGPSSGKLGGGTLLQVQVSANLDPVADPTKPLLSVDMPAGVVLEARWNNTTEIELIANDSGSQDALFKVEHTLAPHLTVFIDAYAFKLTYDYDATTLLGYIPGSKWTYVGKGTKAFEPWGFTPAVLKVVGPALADAQLFSIPMPQITGSTAIQGNIAINATTEPTFNYSTTEIVLGGNGDPLGANNRVWRIPTTDADFLEIPAKVKGTITYSGTLLVRPSVTINKIGNFTIPGPGLVLDIAAAGVDLPFESGANPIGVVFPTTMFHIGLPNVKAPKVLDVGSAELGRLISKPVDIKNTGEMNAALTFTSSNPQFAVTSAKVSGPAKNVYSLDVKFTPTAEGVQSADITVTSNDPNEPVQVIKVTGIGTKQPEPPVVPAPVPEDNSGGSGDTGCGCRTTPASTDAAGLAFFGVALSALLRRRRRA
jgi:MYXO-CTERM domain-containing protein